MIVLVPCLAEKWSTQINSSLAKSSSPAQHAIFTNNLGSVFGGYESTCITSVSI